MKTREQAEARSIDAANKRIESIAPSDPNFDYAELEVEYENFKLGFLQCFDEMTKHKDLSKTCGYCVKEKQGGEEYP